MLYYTNLFLENQAIFPEIKKKRRFFKTKPSFFHFMPSKSKDFA